MLLLVVGMLLIACKWYKLEGRCHVFVYVTAGLCCGIADLCYSRWYGASVLVSYLGELMNFCALG